jgi:hypothetical protein
MTGPFRRTVLHLGSVAEGLLEDRAVGGSAAKRFLK